jgi:tetratricopeptide (TPR) repeat protein
MRCENCHVGDPQKGFSSFDFASDAKHEKQVARTMMKMVSEINGTYIAEVSGEDGVRVECVTCHRGQEHPVMLEDAIGEVLEKDGLDAAVARYHELRDRYYGSHTYDFTEGPLAEVAVTQLRSGNSDNAIALLQLNLEMNPESMMSMYQLGEAYEATGNTAKALEQYEACQKIMPNPRLTRKIEELKNQ